MIEDYESVNIIKNRLLNDERLVKYDRREGSVIYNSVVPLAYELMNLANRVELLTNNTYLLGASGEHLDNRAKDYGLIRFPASPAVLHGTFKKYSIDEDGNKIKDDNGNYILEDMQIDDGTRFAILNIPDLVYEFHTSYNGYENVLVCDTAGEIGNKLNKKLIPLSVVNNLVEAYIGEDWDNLIVTGEDEESDEELRARCTLYLNAQSFGGNVADYTNWTNELKGVQAVKVYPTPNNRSGIVRLSVVGSNYEPLPEESLENIKNEFTPTGDDKGFGIAPIGHVVEVTTPILLPIQVNVTIIKYSQADGDELLVKVKQIIENHIKGKRVVFGDNRSFEYKNIEIFSADIIELLNELKEESVETIRNVENLSFSISEESKKLLYSIDDVKFSDSNKIVEFKDNENRQYLPVFDETSKIILVDDSTIRD
jgi:uncharacterized phage protein gp47/JayE